MNLQERSNDASHLDRIILRPKIEKDLTISDVLLLGPKFEDNPTISDKLPFHNVILISSSPHGYIFYDLWKTLHKTRRSTLFNNFRQKIIELQNLSKGWDSYNADPPNYKALINSLKTLDALFELQFIPIQIMPSVEGGISFIFTENVKYADIECDNDGDIFAGMSDRTGEPILWQVSQEDEEKSLRETISKISSFLGI